MRLGRRLPAKEQPESSQAESYVSNGFIVQLPKLRANASGYLRESNAARYLDCSISTLQRLRKSGEIKACRLCGTWRYSIEELEAYVDRKAA